LNSYNNLKDNIQAEGVKQSKCNEIYKRKSEEAVGYIAKEVSNQLTEIIVSEDDGPFRLMVDKSVVLGNDTTSQVKRKVKKQAKKQVLNGQPKNKKQKNNQVQPNERKSSRIAKQPRKGKSFLFSLSIYIYGLIDCC